MGLTSGSRTLVFRVAAACLLCGCSAGSTSSHMNKSLCVADIDANYMVRLYHRTSKHRDGLKPEERSEQLCVEIVPRPLPRAEYTMARQEVPAWPSYSHYQYRNVEARADSAGRRVWFIDRATGSIIGTVDRDSGATTGPSDTAPDWATRDTGRVLGP